MVVGILSVRLHIPESRSLKDKRQVIKSLLAKIRNKFNVSAAEVDDNDLWQQAVIGIASIGNEKKFVNGVLDQVLNHIRSMPSAELVDFQIEIL
ncbi:MAG TPA: DUF503 domain-containing protein [Nitrospiria bacterium]|nr:DUF503 domain-containing protein [Nitrospiria bacterium]